MKAKHAGALLALVATLGGLVPGNITDAAGEGWANIKPQVSGDWVVWQDYDGTVREILPAVPFPSEPDPVQATEDLLEFLNTAISEGSLAGTGRGRSAGQRADALYFKLVEAQALSAAAQPALALAWTSRAKHRSAQDFALSPRLRSR